jgi:Uncharacterized membrane protein, required for spore maturation in B.subtilis.
MIALNLTATLFGLGNAATPFGIKAMEELQKLNPSKDTATNSMVMLMAINTAASSSSRRSCCWHSWAPRSTRSSSRS